MVIGETRGQAPDLLRDSGQVQRMMAELHGAQRFRLGWGEADIERETLVLLTEISKALKGSVEATDTIRVTAAANATAIDISTEPLRRATAYATAVAHHVLEQATRTCLRAYRFAKAADAP